MVGTRARRRQRLLRRFRAHPGEPQPRGHRSTSDVALVVLDLNQDGWPDFLVSRNNDETLAFRNNGVAGRKSVRVSLRGPAGNRDAIGARITVELTDGSAMSSEVYAGSGYYSQSSAACFFGYSEANAPREVRVRWPSGATTRDEFPPGSSSLVVTPPGPVQ